MKQPDKRLKLADKKDNKDIELSGEYQDTMETTTDKKERPIVTKTECPSTVEELNKTYCNFYSIPI